MFLRAGEHRVLAGAIPGAFNGALSVGAGALHIGQGDCRHWEWKWSDGKTTVPVWGLNKKKTLNSRESTAVTISTDEICSEPDLSQRKQRESFEDRCKVPSIPGPCNSLPPQLLSPLHSRRHSCSSGQENTESEQELYPEPVFLYWIFWHMARNHEPPQHVGQCFMLSRTTSEYHANGLCLLTWPQNYSRLNTSSIGANQIPKFHKMSFTKCGMKK